MINKRMDSLEGAVSGIEDGAVLLVGGFGNAGEPIELLNVLAEKKPRNLTIVSNNAGSGELGIGRLLTLGCVAKFICSFPRVEGAAEFGKLYESGEIELELVPQGTLAERIRSAGAGIPGFYTRTSTATPLAEGKEVREFDGLDYVFETAIKGDAAFIKAHRGDRWGNLTYTKSARNFNPVMAMAADLTVAQVSEIVELGEIDPELVVTPGIFVGRVVEAKETSL